MLESKIIRTSFMFALIVIGTMIFARELSHLDQLNHENDKVVERIERLEALNRDYMDRIDSIKNDEEYLEKILREELGMIREGERIFKFSN